MVEDLKIWQILPPPAASTACTEFFLKYGVALLWPGDPGPWTPGEYTWNYALQGWIKPFADSMSPGDLILLRSGPTRIRGIGVVAGNYTYEERFDDVQGFDLQHCRRVRWCRLPEEYDFDSPVFTKGRFSAVRKTAVRDYVRRFVASPPTHWQNQSLPELPPEEGLLDEVPDEISHVVAQARDYFPLTGRRSDFGEFPSEAEMVVHFVVPFLSSLGWRPEHIAVEWGPEKRLKADVALFTALPRTPENCCVIVEAKRLGAGVEQAIEQAMGYAAKYGVRSNILVTDGIRYRLYDPKGEHLAYANLVRLKESATKLFDRLRRP